MKISNARLVFSAALAVVVPGCSGGAWPGPIIPTPAPIAKLPPGALTTAPAQLSFSSLGSGAVQSFAASEPGYSGAFSESDTCATTAKVATASALGPSSLFQVTPLAVGTCAINITDLYGQKRSIAVTITQPPSGAQSPLGVTPTTLSFASTNAAAQTFTVAESGYSGAITETDSCAGVASISATGTTAGPSSAYAVTPRGAGTCIVTVADTFAQKANVAIVVAAAPPPSAGGPLVANPTALTFTASGPANDQTFNVSEQSYTGQLVESDSCAGIATITPATTPSGASVNYTVTPLAGGACSISIIDSFKQKAIVSLSVTTTGVIVQ